ncbi:hypothetical protein CALVIDRAFT_248617 [Calocera viscosa TUFC12733]|uniref:Uncharacterized protein n=1 Tax=Calocera viscosa (strain TUFC12733) TaxID=1330018 RepID=A0A167JCE3_CALVF|nr:hypothetical protein CALVIDRAFT_248617 [Calocera viscosa TUFC12733]
MSAQSVLQYFSYFIIIWWVWASQCLYDARYQSNDWVHRLFKLMQLASFTYVGVFAQDFDPSYVVRPADITTIDAVAAVGGSRSFKGVALAYAVSRILLAVQYMYSAPTLSLTSCIAKAILQSHVSLKSATVESALRRSSYPS